MTNYIQIDSIQNKRWKGYAEKIDGRKPDINNPNDVGDAGDRQLSNREIKKLEQMITEYYTKHPESDNLGIQIPVEKLVSEAMTEVFGGTLKYLKYQAEQTMVFIAKLLPKAGSLGPTLRRSNLPLLGQAR